MSRSISPLLLTAALLAASACTFQFDRSLEPGELRGTVVFQDSGAALLTVPGARVSLEGARIQVRSDAQGRFVIRQLPEGRYTLRIEHDANGDGLVDAGLMLRDVQLGQGRDLGRITIGRLGSISGEVLRNSEPLPGAEVALVQQAATVADDGSFQFERLLPGAYQLGVVAHHGADTFVLAEQLVEVKPGQDTPVTLDLDGLPSTPTGSLQGTARLVGTADHGDIGVTLPGGSTQLVTGPDGGYLEAQLPAGIYTVRAHKDGFLPSIARFVVVGGDTTLAPDLLLARFDATCGRGVTGDQDDDGVGDECDLCPATPDPDQLDLNHNGIGDACEDEEDEEDDEDGDGVPLPEDNCPFVANADQTDSDGDGVGDACDNCPSVANTDQADADSDGTGDACEPPPSICDGDGWCIEEPLPLLMTGARTVTGTSDTNVWVLGDRDVRAFDGRGWRDETPPLERGESLQALWMAPEGDVWVVGWPSVVFQRTGAGWTRHLMPRSDLDLSMVAGRSASDVWIGGSYDEGTPIGQLFHWDGDAFTEDTSPAAALAADYGLLHATPDGRIWLTGRVDSSYGAGLVQTAAGEDWREDASGEFMYSLPTSAWSIGTKTYFSTVSPYSTGGAPSYVLCDWQDDAPAGSDPCDWAYGSFSNMPGGAIGGTSEDDVWLGGSLRWDGARWLHQAPPSDSQLQSLFLWGSDGWALDGDGALLRFDASWWRRLDGRTLFQVVAISVAPDGTAFALGNNPGYDVDAGALLGWNGAHWEPTPVALPSPEPSPPPRPLELKSVYTASASSAWAVGAAGTMLEWDGARWSYPPNLPSYFASWEGVAGTGSDNVWAWTSWSAWRWDGSAWNSVPALDGGHEFRRIVPVSSGVAYALSASNVFRWTEADGWQARPTEAIDASEPTALWASEDEHVWVALSSGALLHHHPSHPAGETWREESLPLSRSRAYQPPRTTTLWGTGADEVFALDAEGAVFRRDAQGTWTRLELGGWRMRAVGGRPGDVWLLGDRPMHGDGTTFAPLPRWSHPASHLVDVWGRSATEVWAIGVGEDAPPMAYRRTATGWQSVDLPYPGYPTAIRGSANGGLWVAGHASGLSHFDGAAWTFHPVDDANELNGLWGRGQETWAVGSQGKVLRHDGQTWAAVEHGVASIPGLYAVAGTDTDLFAVGDSLAILHFDGATWRDESFSDGEDYPPTLGDVAAVATDGGIEAWAVGSGGAVLHRKGGVWTKQSVASLLGVSDHELYFRAVEARSATDVWVFGDAWSSSLSGPVVLHFGPTGWKNRTPRFARSLSAATLLPDGTIFAVGTDRTILRLKP